jgi:hypothetical protein
MTAPKDEVRLPQRSEEVSGNEAKGLKPIAASQKKNKTLQPTHLIKPKASGQWKKSKSGARPKS